MEDPEHEAYQVYSLMIVLGGFLVIILSIELLSLYLRSP